MKSDPRFGNLYEDGDSILGLVPVPITIRRVDTFRYMAMYRPEQPGKELTLAKLSIDADGVDAGGQALEVWAAARQLVKVTDPTLTAGLGAALNLDGAAPKEPWYVSAGTSPNRIAIVRAIQND